MDFTLRTNTLDDSAPKGITLLSFNKHDEQNQQQDYNHSPYFERIK